MNTGLNIDFVLDNLIDQKMEERIWNLHSVLDCKKKRNKAL